MHWAVATMLYCDTSRDDRGAGSVSRRAESQLEGLAAQFVSASPSLIALRELQRRIDTKYVVPVATLDGLLAELGHVYAAIRTEGTSWVTYESTYFDTPDLQCFHDHRRGRRLRHKVRIRHYPSRALSFLELKTKRNDVLTEKQRLVVSCGQAHLGERERAFLRGRVGSLADTLAPVLRIDYRRLSLLGLAVHERATIDVGIECTGLAGETASLDAVAIVEIKRDGPSTTSPMAARLARAGQRECSLSKYVAAITRLHPDTRHNRLAHGLRALDRSAR